MPVLPSAFSTRRLRLRRYVPDDASWYAEMAARNKPHLARFESGNAVMRIASTADARRAIDGFIAQSEAGKAAFLGAFLKEDGAFVAQIYIGRNNADLPGYLIGFFCEVDHLRQGYTGEAAAAALAVLFNDCGAARVGLWCDDANVASQHIALRLGMVQEGHIRADTRHADGTVTGSLCFGLLSEEFFGQPA